MTVGLFHGEIYPTETKAGCIDIFEDVWPDPVGTIEFLEETLSNSEKGIGWTRATTIGSGVNQNLRTNLMLGLTHHAMHSNSPELQAIHNQMYTLLVAATAPYMKKHDIDGLWHEGYNVLKYKSGTEYGAHYDGSTSTHRCVSAIVYLNDEYTGGEVEFTNFNIKIKPKPGSLLLFPSNYAYTHIAHPVQTGTKYAVVTWLHDQPIR